jgi:DnaJ-class molecular chaperone
MRCHYEVLGVEQTADADELKKAYRKQVNSLIKLNPKKSRFQNENTPIFTKYGRYWHEV